MLYLFWISLFLVAYTYLIYPMAMYLFLKLKHGSLNTEHHIESHDLPSTTLIVPAYNESYILQEKINNCLSLDYPKNKLKIIFITDGSDDNPHSILSEYTNIIHLHDDKRAGKFSAMKRAIHYVSTDTCIFTDANAMLNKASLKHIMIRFKNNKVGVVAGEKRIIEDDGLGGSTEGESAYWKYESIMKKMDCQFHTVVGAVGELFAIRTDLFQDNNKDYILDDFMLSLNANLKGFKTAYAPEACAYEKASFSLYDEYKRKVRIASGGWESLIELSLNPRLYINPKLLLQLISRRAMRWMIAPIALLLILVSNIFLVQQHWLYSILMILQLIFYSIAFIGYKYSDNKRIPSLLKIPFYFGFMHLAAFMGMIKYFKGNRTNLWEKVRRLDSELSVRVD